MPVTNANTMEIQVPEEHDEVAVDDEKYVVVQPLEDEKKVTKEDRDEKPSDQRKGPKPSQGGSSGSDSGSGSGGERLIPQGLSDQIAAAPSH